MNIQILQIMALNTSIMKNYDYSKIINELVNSIPIINEKIKKNPDIEIKNDLEELLLDCYIELAIAKYSSNAQKLEINNILLEAINIFNRVFKWKGFKNHYGGYDQMLWLVSISILVDIDIDDFKKITMILKRDKVRDKLLNFLIKYKQSDWIDDSSTFIQKSPYEYTSKIIYESNEDNGLKLIVNYLKPNLWYNSHSDSSWHDSHLNTNTNAFFGYWAWETAAIVKIKGWNDDALKGLDYYPYDSVHW